MDLPIKTIVILAIVVLVLVTLSMFFTSSTGGSLSRAEAERIFNTKCVAYVQQGCDWSVTKTSEFADYMRACRVLYGDYREAYSCLYSFCQGCFESYDLRCANLCHTCAGHEAAGIDRTSCCTRYSAQCAGSSFDCSETC